MTDQSECTICKQPPIGGLHDWHGYSVCQMCQPVSRIIDRMGQEGILTIYVRPFDYHQPPGGYKGGHKSKVVSNSKRNRSPGSTKKGKSGRKVVRIKRKR